MFNIVTLTPSIRKNHLLIFKFNVMKKLFTLFTAFVSWLAFANQASAAEITFTVEVPTPTYEVWLVGNFNGWNNGITKMNKVDDTHYTITLDEATFNDGITAATLKYKYLSGPGDWAYVEKNENGGEISDRDYPGAGVTDVVKKWATVYNPNVAPIEKDILIEVYVPKAVKELYVTGWHNGWKSPGSEGTKMTWNEEMSDEGGNEFFLTIHTPDANKTAYKFAAGPSWVYEQDSADLKITDTSADKVYNFMPKFKRIYPGEAALKDVTINVTAPAGTESVYMMGSHFGWDGTSWQAGTKNQDGTFTFVFKFDLIEYKYYNKQDWTGEEKTADGKGVENRKADAQLAVTFNDVIAAWPAPSGVPTLDTDKYTVRVANKTVSVDGITSKFELYDLTGRTIQSVSTVGSFTSTTLNAGVYILRVDGATQKVMIR
ncbi:MAG: hypothetical protein BGP01_01990 [Paludibacter sp. 47-17]|nr:MAG: hypothetical protein BGP01_01990 [Paludibacter sp. 47-17]